MRPTVLLLIACLACGGIEVDVPAEGAVWTIDRRDSGAAGDAEHGHLVTVATAAGYTVAADGQAVSLSVFDRTGALVRRSGRSGQGPGEFASIHTVHAYRGDSVVVHDGMMQRLTVTPVAGGEARAITIRLGRGTQLRGVRDDSVFIMSAQGHGSSRYLQGLYRDSVALLAVSPTGHEIDTIGHFADRYQAAGPEEPFLILSPTAQFAASGDRLCYADAMRPRIECFDRGRARATVLTWPQPVRPVTTELKRRYLEFYVEHAPPFPLDQLRDRLKSVVWLDTLPAIASPLLMESDGTVWVFEYQLPSEWAPGTWRVLSAHGELLARVITPPEFRLTSIDGNVLWGIWQDSLDVTTIRSYSVHRTPAAGSQH